MRKFAAILTASLLLGGCALLGGESYVMSYGAEAGTDDRLRGESFTFSVSVSGR